MDRIKGAGHVNHMFVAEDTDTNRPPTEITPEWMNGVQEEICSVIEAAGIALDGATMNQMLTALRSSGVFTTAAQFDNSTKAATTAFVKKFGKQYSNVIPFTGALTGVVGHIGGAVYGYSNTANSYSIFDSTSLPVGATVTIWNYGDFGMTIVRQGTDKMQVYGSSYITSFTLKPGAYIEATLVAVGIWQINGTGVLANSFDFLALIATNGYQKLPSGLIIQWGAQLSSAVALSYATLPIAFPNAFLQGTMTVGTESEACFAQLLGADTTGINFNVYGVTAGRKAYSVSWIAIGY
jgi:hypothetical protein